MYKIIGADGREYGPVGANELRQWIAEGRANAQSQILAEGGSEWRALGTCSEFAADLAVPSVRVPATLPITYAGSTAAAKTNGMAIAGLICGLISVPTLCCCCLTMPFSILGIVFSCIALSQIRSNPMQGGRGMAIAGIILSILGFLLMVLWLTLGAANAAFDPSGLSGSF